MIDVPMGPVQDERFTYEEAQTWRFAGWETLVVNESGVSNARLPVLVTDAGQTISIEAILRKDGLAEPEVAETVDILGNVLDAIVCQDPTGETQKLMRSIQPLVVLPENDYVPVDRAPIDIVRGLGGVVSGIRRGAFGHVDLIPPQLGNTPIVAHEFEIGVIGKPDELHRRIPLLVTQDRGTGQTYFSSGNIAVGHIVHFRTAPGHNSPTQVTERLVPRNEAQESD